MQETARSISHTVRTRDQQPIHRRRSENWSAGEDLGTPGSYPYTRGVYPTMYRGRLWTMRQFAGFGSADDTNLRFKYLLEHGQTGLSVAFDMPTLMGIDADDPRAHGEIGHCGVAVSSLDDMERLFAGIPLDRVTTSMTINGPAAVIFAMYLAVAQRRGVPHEQLGGTLQNDILKEYIAQKEWLFPPEPSLRLITDTVAYCTTHVPQMASDQYQRLPHSGGRFDRGPGAGLYPV